MKLTWRSRRQLSYLGAVLGLVLGLSLLGYGVYWLSKPPPCHDGPIGEAPPGVPICWEGVLNPHEVSDLERVWVRKFSIRPGEYTVVARFRNPNMTIGTPSLRYFVDLWGVDNELLISRPGENFVNPGEEEVVLIETGVARPSDPGGEVRRAEIRLDPNTPWMTNSRPLPEFRVSSRGFSNQTPARLQAEIANLSAEVYSGIEVVVVMYDEHGNAVTASATVVDRLEGYSSEDVHFTWPERITPEPERIEFYPRASVF